MPQLFSFCGVDGCGKTALMMNLQARSDLSHLQFLYVPQYRLPRGHKFAALVGSLERAGQFADSIGQPALKASILFLATSLFGRVMSRTAQSVSERHPALDCLVYSFFYGRFLQDGLERRTLAEGLGSLLSLESLRQIEDYAKEVSGGVSFWEFPQWLRGILQSSQERQIELYESIFRVGLPDSVAMLKIEETFLARRLEKKFAAVSAQGQVRELHEQIPSLMQMQGLYEKVLGALSEKAMIKFQIHEIRSDEDSSLVAEKISTDLAASHRQLRQAEI